MWVPTSFRLNLLGGFRTTGLTFMLQRPSIKPLREILEINHINLLQMQARSESFAKSIMRVKRRGEKRRTCQQGFEMERKRMSVGADGESDWSLEKMSGANSQTKSEIQDISVGRKEIPYRCRRSRKFDSLRNGTSFSRGSFRIDDGDLFGDCDVVLFLHSQDCIEVHGSWLHGRAVLWYALKDESSRCGDHLSCSSTHAVSLGE